MSQLGSRCGDDLKRPDRKYECNYEGNIPPAQQQRGWFCNRIWIGRSLCTKTDHSACFSIESCIFGSPWRATTLHITSGITGSLNTEAKIDQDFKKLLQFKKWKEVCCENTDDTNNNDNNNNFSKKDFEIFFVWKIHYKISSFEEKIHRRKKNSSYEEKIPKKQKKFQNRNKNVFFADNASSATSGPETSSGSHDDSKQGAARCRSIGSHTNTIGSGPCVTT